MFNLLLKQNERKAENNSVSIFSSKLMENKRELNRIID
jgi:hypothetical protein